MGETTTALVLYHFFHPDDVVSAQHFADLCRGLKDRGWRIVAMPSNRSCHDPLANYFRTEVWQGIDIHRVYRPPFSQASNLGRLLNAGWMICRWSLAGLRHRPDLLIIGTDPVFSVLTAIPWKILRPRTKVFHWCFDLHPEAAIAEGMVSPSHPAVRILRPLLRRAYRACDLIGSLGPCMTRRLQDYAPATTIGTYTPWALSEPAAPLQVDPEERATVFGNASLSLLYSGNFGMAHDAELILALARRLRNHPGIHFAFSVRGHRAKALQKAVGPDDHNVSLVAFSPQERLEHRLSAADIQMVSLRPDFVGTVVPSKFQGALAVGRPILYAGPIDSAVALWIKDLGLGWTITSDNLEQVAQQLIALESNRAALADLNLHCHQAYQSTFSKKAVLDALNQDLKGLISSRGPD